MRLTRSLILCLAVGSAIGAAVIARKSMVRAPQQVTHIAAATVDLLVVKRAISAGERIEAADLRWHVWPQDALPEGAVTGGAKGQAERFTGAYARYPLIAGEPIAEAKLIWPGKGSQIAALIEDGKRAVAVPVREESAVGGLIQPHDRVDVLWSGSPTISGERNPVAQILLHGVKVLAVGKSVQANRARSGNTTATLELTPEQAQILAGARIRGELSLALISAADRRVIADTQYADSTSKPPQNIRVMKFGHRSARAFRRTQQ